MTPELAFLLRWQPQLPAAKRDAFHLELVRLLTVVRAAERAEVEAQA